MFFAQNALASARFVLPLPDTDDIVVDLGTTRSAKSEIFLSELQGRVFSSSRLLVL